MLYVSSLFLAFLAGLTLLYYVLPRRTQPYLLLVANLCFYAFAGPRALLYLLLLSLLSFFFALAIGQETALRRRKIWLCSYLVLGLGALVYAKFSLYLLRSLHLYFGLPLFTVPVLVPLGLSFFTLQAVAYVVDVYRQKIQATKNPIKFMLFMSYFPIIVQGPISRWDELSEQLWAKHPFDYTQVKQGALLLLWGFFKKLVIANRAASFADPIFASYERYSGFMVMMGILLYTLQIYADFSGAVDICRGASEMLDIKIRNNFDHPYFATSVKDFWRRWHISLSLWLRDYVYIPLGGNRRGRWRKHLNVFLTFLVSGLWHGVGFHYICWGGYHGLCQVLGDLLREPKDRLIKAVGLRSGAFSFRLGQQICTFILIAYSWLLFRANGLRAALHMTRSLFGTFYQKTLYMEVFPDGRELVVLMLATLLLFTVSCFQQKRALRDVLERQNLWFRWTVYLLLLFGSIIFGVYGQGYNASDFLYMQF